MSQVFNNYTGQCATQLQSIKKIVSNFTSQQPYDKKQTALKQIKTQLYDCQKCIKLSQTQLVSFKGRQKNLALQKVKAFKTQIEVIKKKIMQIQQDMSLQKNKQLLTSHSLQLSEQGNKYKKISDQEVNQNLKESVKVMYETMDMSENIQYELEGQSQRMVENKNKLTSVRDELKKGEKVIKKMMLRIRRNKLLLWSIIAFVLLVIVLIIWKIVG